MSEPLPTEPSIAADRPVDILSVLAAATTNGAVWNLPHGGDLDANIVSLPTGDSIAEHRNTDVDVLIVAASGSGSVTVDGTRHPLEPGGLMLIERGALRSIHAGPDGIGYLSIHRRRGSIEIGEKPTADPAVHAPGELPDGLELVRTTPIFDQDSVPAGLLAAHRVAAGVWGRLVVHRGALTFTFEDAPDQARRIEAGSTMVIPPQRPHHLTIDRNVEFAVEFHRPPEDA